MLNQEPLYQSSITLGPIFFTLERVLNSIYFFEFRSFPITIHLLYVYDYKNTQSGINLIATPPRGSKSNLSTSFDETFLDEIFTRVAVFTESLPSV